MKPLRLGVLILLLLIPTSSFSSTYDIKTVAWRELSDRQLTETGQAALKVYGDAWQHAESAHFVYHFHDAKQAETVFVHAEAYYDWIKQLFGVKEDAGKRKSHVFVFEDKAAWKEFGSVTPERLPGAEAFTNGFELFLYREPFYLAPQRVLAHEITHLVLFRFVEGRVPRFLNEGFAEFIGTKAAAMKADGEDYRVRTFPKIPEDDFIEPADLAAMTEYPAGKQDIFYRESEMLARFLLLNHPPKTFHELLKATAGKKSFEEALGELYGMDMETFTRKFKVYAMTR